MFSMAARIHSLVLTDHSTAASTGQLPAYAAAAAQPTAAAALPADELTAAGRPVLVTAAASVITVCCASCSDLYVSAVGVAEQKPTHMLEDEVSLPTAS